MKISKKLAASLMTIALPFLSAESASASLEAACQYRQGVAYEICFSTSADETCLLECLAAADAAYSLCISPPPFKPYYRRGRVDGGGGGLLGY